MVRQDFSRLTHDVFTAAGAAANGHAAPPLDAGTTTPAHGDFADGANWETAWIDLGGEG